MFKRNLFKRFLPIALSVAMTVQSLPVTSYAAEGTTEPETAIEQTTDEVVDDDAGDKETGGSEAVDGQNEGGTEEAKSPETQTTKQTEETKAAEETKTAEETKAAEETKGTGETQTEEENKEAGETQTETEEAVEEAADNAEAVLDTKIVVDENYLGKTYCTGDKVSYDDEKDVVYTTYTDTKSNPFETLIDNIKGTSYNIVTVEVDGNEKDDLKDKLTYKWQVKGAEGYADMPAGDVPVNAGEYKLVITMPKVDGACNKATAEINFEIKKQELTVFTNFDDEVAPGTKVSEFVKEIKENYTIGIDSNNSLNKDTYVSKVTVTVKNAVDNTELSDDTELLKTGDYCFNMTVELAKSFASNYAVKEIPTIDITMETAPATEIKVDILKEEAFGKTYDGSKIADPVVGTDYKVQVVYGQDEEGKDLAIAEDKLKDKFTYAWIEDDKETELKEDPVDAGTYYYQISYAGEDGLYAESETPVKVVIEPASIYIVPELKTQKTFYAGMSEKSVLDEVDYKVFDTKDDKEHTVDRETFWGVSYNSTSKTQSFEPVFKLQVARATAEEKDGKTVYSFPKDKDGNVVYNYVDNNGAKLESPEKAVYRIVFAEKKAVYNANGTPNTTVDINRTETNSAETNYEVDIKSETIAKNAAAVEVKAAQTAVIDVSALYKLFGDTAKDKAGESFENPNIRTYEPFTALYDARDAYKKAVVTADSKELAKNNDVALTYTWQIRTGWVEETDENGKVTTKTPVWENAGYNNNGIYWTDGFHTYYAPYKAGDYRLVVRYSHDEYVADDAYVYYTIEQQKVAAVPSGKFTQPYSGTSISDFRNKVSEELEHGVYKIAEYTPGKNNTVTDADLLSWVYDDEADKHEYGIQWVVERALKDTATGAYTGEYEEVNDNFILGEKYRLGLKITGIDLENDLGDNYRYYDEKTDEQGNTSYVYYTQYLADEINPVEMGNINISVVVDETKLAKTERVYDGTPFDISEDIKNGFIKFYTTNGADVGKEITGEELDKLGIEYVWYFKDGYGYSEEAINGGKYNLYIKFTGNETYAPINYGNNYRIDKANGNELVFEITKREITATPVLNEIITAGEDKDTVFAVEDNGNVKVVFGGDILEAEKPDFTYGKYTVEGDEYEGYKAGYESSVIVLKDGESYNGWLRSNTTYEAQLGIQLRTPYSRNYNVTCTKTEFTPVRGKSTVTREACNGLASTALKAAVDDKDANNFVYTITPREGIPFAYEGLYDTKLKKDVPGNYFVFKIQAPKEFRAKQNGNRYEDSFANFIYENSIVNDAKGYVLDTNDDDGTICIAFNAVKDAKHTFKIRWADNYVETFTVDFTGAVLEDNLKKAVAPKSLAFNNPNTKMVAGETQQLDVKVTKKQLSDVICLDYEVDNTEILSVTDKGYLTALKKGSATVKVIPSYLNDEGEKVAIAGAKAASVKITVVDVTAPKIKTVKAYDTFATVTYPELSDGYRREIYVLEGKNIKATEFESKIDSMKNGVWKGIFATAPSYGENLDSDTKTASMNVTGLKPNTDYTVYVRNVNGIRTLEDGTKVIASKAGAVKSFKTLLAQVDALSGYFDIEKGPVYSNEDTNYNYEVKLSDKTAQLLVQGKYPEINGNQSADNGDAIWYTLPLANELRSTYQNPKLTYVISSTNYYETPQTKSEIEQCKKDGYTLVSGNKYFKPTTLATINKTGKITLKGVGSVYIYVYDSETGLSDWVELYITAAVSKITAKNIKLKVGEIAHLSKYLTYYEGKKKLTGNVPYDLYIEDVAALNNEYFSVQKRGSDYAVVAKKPGGTLDIKVADLNVQEAGGQPVTIKVQSSAIDSVKNLKVEEIRDTYFNLKFTYSLYNSYSCYDKDAWWNHFYGMIEEIDNTGFRIEVRDSSNKLIKDEFVSLEDIGYENDSQKGTRTFSYCIGNLTRLSSYKVSVTAVFGTEKSKAVTKSVKTTNIPASYDNLNDTVGDGGMDIAIGNTLLRYYRSLVSNNTYTLIASGANPEARTRLTDTLTWKSSNPKVATVKANAGTYTATLKALKKGSTTIEVTSKVTKKIIARWTVFVNATGEAGDRLYGDLEPEAWTEYGNEIDETNMEVLTVANPVKAVLGANESVIAVFKAPAYGSYTFSSTPSMFIYDIDGQLIDNYTSRKAYTLEKDQKLYFRVLNAQNKNNVTAQIWVSSYTIYDELTFGTPLEVKGGKYQYVVFTAPETNYYTFYADKKNVSIWGYSNEAGYSQDLSQGETIAFWVYANETFNLNVKKREPATITTDGLAGQKVTKATSQWYAFEAPADGEYLFKSTDASANISAKFYTALNSTYGTSATAADKNFVYKKTDLNKGDVVYFEVTTSSETEVTYKLSVATTTAVVKLGTPQEKTIEKAGDKQWFSFQAPEAGTYNFRTTVEKVGEVTPALTINYDTNGTDNSVLNMGASTPTNGTMTQSEDVYLNKGDIIYISVSSNTDASKVKINVTDVEAQAKKAQLALDTAKEDNLSALDAKWYTFTAPKRGTYIFTAKVTERTKKDETPNAKADVTVAGNDEENGNALDFPFEKDLAAGQKVTLKVYTTDDSQTDKVTLKVSELTATEFTDGKVKVDNLAAGESRWVAYKVPADDYYEFTAEKTGDGTVTVEKYTSLDNNGNGDPFNMPLSLDLKAGKVIYLKLTATGKVDSYTITAKAVDVTTLTAGTELVEYTIPAKGTKWFKFTSAQTAKYQFTSELPEGITATRYGSFTSGDYGTAFYGEELNVDAGKTWYFKLTNSTDAEQKAKLKIAEVSVKDITADKKGSVTLKDGKSQWFVFTAAEAGRYEFKTTASSKENTTASADLDLYSNVNESYIGSGYISSSDKIIYLRSGQTVYAKVTGSTTSDEGATVELSTDKLAILGEIDAANENPKTVAVSGKKANEYVWVEFTVPEDGVYTFSADGAAEGTSVTARYSTNTDSSLYWLDSLPKSLTLTKNKKLTIGVYANVDNASYTLKVAKRAEEELTVAQSVSKELRSGDEMWVTFKVPETGRYAIKTTGLGEGVTASISDIGGNRYAYTESNLPDAGFYYTFVADMASKITFKVTTTATEKKNITVKAEPVTATDITATGTASIDVTKVAPGELVWYTFTAPEDAYYQYKVAGDVATESYYMYGDNVNQRMNSVYANPWEMHLGEDDSYVFAVDYRAATTNNIAVSMTKVTAAELTEAAPYKVEVKNLIANEKRYISFVAPEDGRYIFAKDMDATINATIYKSIGISDRALSWGVEYPLKKGEELLFAVSASTVPKNDFNISVSHVQPKEIAVSEDAKTLEFTDTDSRWMVFTAEKTGQYKFDFSESDVSTYVYLYDSIADSSSVSGKYAYVSTLSYGSITYSVNKGDNVYFKIDESGAVKLKAKASLAQEMTELRIGENAFDTTGESASQYAYFTAAETGVYKFTVNANRYLLYSSDINSGFESISGNVAYVLNAGDSVYFNEFTNNTGTITVEQKVSSIGVLAENVEQSVAVDTESYQWLSFTAPETGIYNFALSEYSQGYVYTEPRLGYDYGGYYSYRSYIYAPGFTKELRKNQTIYLSVKSNNVQTTSVSIKAELAKIVEIYSYDDEPVVTLNKGEVAYLHFTSDYDPASWNFDVTADKSVSVSYAKAMYNSFTSAGSGKSVTIASQDLNSDEELYIKVAATQDNTKVSVYAYISQYILRKGYYDSDVAASSRRTYKFTATSTEWYNFWIYYDESDIDAVLTDVDGNVLSERYDNTDSYDFSLGADLKSGQVVYLTLINNEEDEVSPEISIYSSKSYPSLTLDTPVSASVSTYGRNYFNFTPTESGTYQFQGNRDLFAWVSILEDDWNDEVYLNEGFTVDITAGTTVYLTVYGPEDEEYDYQIQYNLTVTKLAEDE